MKVFSNLAISLDGKIADPGMPHKMLGSNEDRRRMQVIRKKCDIVLLGAHTLRVVGKSIKIKSKEKTLRQPANGIITASGKIDAQLDFWKDPEVIRFIFTTAAGESEALKNSQDRAFVVVVGEKELDPLLILKRLKESGFKNVLVEGGGETMALFFQHRLIQEVYLTLTPWILGGRQSPTLVGGDFVLKPWVRLKKIKADWREGDLFTHYKVLGAKRV